MLDVQVQGVSIYQVNKRKISVVIQNALVLWLRLCQTVRAGLKLFSRERIVGMPSHFQAVTMITTNQKWKAHAWPSSLLMHYGHISL